MVILLLPPDRGDGKFCYCLLIEVTGLLISLVESNVCMYGN